MLLFHFDLQRDIEFLRLAGGHLYVRFLVDGKSFCGHGDVVGAGRQRFELEVTLMISLHRERLAVGAGSRDGRKRDYRARWIGDAAVQRPGRSLRQWRNRKRAARKR